MKWYSTCLSNVSPQRQGSWKSFKGGKSDITFVIASLRPIKIILVTWLGNSLTHYHTMPHFDVLKIYSCGNIVRKGEIAWNKQFLL